MAGVHRKNGEGESVSLKEHFEALLAAKDLRDNQRFEAGGKALDAALLAQQTAVQAALLAADRAVIKAEISAEKRFDAVNEFRGAYQDIIAQQMPRTEAEQRLKTLSDKIDKLENASSQSTGRSSGISSSWGVIVTVVVLVATIITLIIKL